MGYSVIVKKYAGITSTAEGYDFIRITKINGRFYNSIRYKNISAASMKRFYTLSKSMMDFYTTKTISFDDFYKYNLDFLYNH